MTLQPTFDFPEHAASDPGAPIIVDSFAGGGGASTGIEMALGRSPDIAINHDEIALALHAANHPETEHLNSNIWKVDPSVACRGRPVGFAWFSPDCKDHSKAKGGKPIRKNIRDLAWVVVLWAKRARPAVIALENVEEFRDWGPLTADNRPCKDRRGQTFKHWVKELRRLGYRVEWRELRACDYGAPTIRKRLFLIARCDGQPIVWPEPTHGAPRDPDVVSGKLKQWRTAAEIIDWSLPCPSIFDTSAEIMEKYGLRAVRPLADNTLKRIARGVKRYVLDAAKPFIVSVNHGDSGGRREYPSDAPLNTLTQTNGLGVVVPEVAPFVTYGQHGGANRPAGEPMHTITASTKDQNAIVAPTLLNVANSKTTGRGPNAWDIEEPLRTLTTSPGFAVSVASLMSYYGEGTGGQNRSHDPSDPVTTVTTGNRHAIVSAFLAQQNVVAANMVSLRGTADSQLKGSDIEGPVPTISAGGGHAGLIAAFMTKYYGAGVGAALDEPMHTLTTKDRFNLVTLEIDGQTYAITDIGMRMLTPREQFRAQGFPDTYEIERSLDGRKFTKTDQTRMCGNSVCPQVAEAIVRANVPHLAKVRIAA